MNCEFKLDVPTGRTAPGSELTLKLHVQLQISGLALGQPEGGTVRRKRMATTTPLT